MTLPEPIILAIELDVTPEDAYTAFTARFADWWPVTSHSLSRQPGTRCRLQAWAGGAVEELAPDGQRHLWGEVQAVEPGRRIRFSWHPGRSAASAQWVTVEFAAMHGGSRLTLTHGGWEMLGEIGPLLRQEYIPGWRHVLGETFAGYVRTLQ